MKLILQIICFLVLSITITSCASKKDVIYLQNIDSVGKNENSNYEPKIQKDDLLSIIISGKQPEATLPFNMPEIQGNYQINQNQDGIKTYLVDINGEIDFPVIGKIKLDGLTRTEAVKLVESKVSEYIIEPSANLRILNFKFSVLGEVNKPGTYKLESERITLLEAISQAGDLTIYGKRDNVLLIREINGKKEYNRIDLTKADFINSPNYYLVQNDVIMVQPNKTKINSSIIGPNITVTISALSLLTTIAIILTR